MCQAILKLIGFEINLFINSDAILNRDALWSIQGKKTIYEPLSLEEYTIQVKYCDERFLRILVTMGICQSIF